MHRFFHGRHGAVIATGIALTVFGWLIFESNFLSGKLVMNAPNHPLGQPLVFEVQNPGVAHGLTVDRAHKRRGKKRLAWSIIDPSGRRIVDDRDTLRRSSRTLKFTPTSAGPHTLLVQRAGGGAPGSSTVTLMVTEADRTVLLPLLDFLW